PGRVTRPVPYDSPPHSITPSGGAGARSCRAWHPRSVAPYGGIASRPSGRWRKRYAEPQSTSPVALLCDSSLLWLWHHSVGGDGDLDDRAAIKAIVTVQCGDGVGHAFERELVRDHGLQR